MHGLTGNSITILCYLGYICAAERFCKEYFKVSKVNEILYVFLNIGAWAAINIAFQNYFKLYLIWALLTRIFFVGLVLLLFRGDAEKKILAASILITVCALVGNFCESFLSCLVLFWRYTVKNIADPFLSEWEASLITGGGLIIVALAVYWMAKHPMSVFFSGVQCDQSSIVASGCAQSQSEGGLSIQRMPRDSNDLSGWGRVFGCKAERWFVILSIPLLAITALMDVANWGACYGILVRSGGNMGLYHDQIFSHAGFCAMAVLSMFAAGFYLSGIERIYLEQKKSSQYHSQIAAYKMSEEQYSRSERLRHDLKNHIIALAGLLDNKEWEKMENYLKNMADNANWGYGEEITGNRVVDILLYQKRISAESTNIVWECDVQMPKICCMNEFDLCVLFGNILDNAVEACERLQRDKPYCSSQPFIDIQAGVVKKCFLLEVKNSTDMADDHRAGFTGQIPRSNKKNQERHGIGLLNVSDVVHKYNGVMNIEVRDGVFAISVLIPLNNAVHDMKQVI